jgi:hypothetical protein
MKRYLLLILSFVFLATSFGVAQEISTALDLSRKSEPLYFGVTFGYSRAMHTYDFSTMNDAKELQCGGFSEGDDNGFYFGINYEHIFGSKVNSQHSIIIRALYSTLPSVSNYSGNEYPSFLYSDNTPPEILHSTTEHNMEIDYQLASFELCYKIKPIRGFNLGITVGPTVDYALTIDNSETFDLVNPDNVRFVTSDEDGNPLQFTPKDGTPYDILHANDPNRVEGRVYWSEDRRTLVMQEGEPADAETIRVGLKVGVQYEINLANSFILVPAVYYNIGLNSLSKDMDWRVNALQMGFDIRYPISFTLR